MLPHSFKDTVPQQHPTPGQLGRGRAVGKEGNGRSEMRGRVRGEPCEEADEAWGWQAGRDPAPSMTGFHNISIPSMPREFLPPSPTRSRPRVSPPSPEASSQYKRALFLWGGVWVPHPRDLLGIGGV